MGTKVNLACAMRPLDSREDAKKFVDKFAIFRRRSPDMVVALVVRQQPRSENARWVPWLVTSPDGAPLVDRVFKSRQNAYRAFMREAGVYANRKEARHAA